MCNCELCAARAAGMDPVEWALRSDPIALAYRQKQRLVDSEGNEWVYKYRNLANDERELREKHSRNPQKLLFNIYRYGSED